MRVSCVLILFYFIVIDIAAEAFHPTNQLFLVNSEQCKSASDQLLSVLGPVGAGIGILKYTIGALKHWSHARKLKKNEEQGEKQKKHTSYHAIATPATPTSPPPISNQITELKKAMRQHSRTLEMLQQDQSAKIQDQPRARAAVLIEKGQETYQTKSYQLVPATCTFIRNAGKQIKDYTSCFGNELQHTFHHEFVTIVQCIANKATNAKSSLCNLVDCTLEFADTGIQCNKSGDLHKTFCCAEVAWTLCDIVKGEALGFGDLALSAAQTIAYPIDSAKQFVTDMCKASYALACFAGNVLELNYLQITNPAEHRQRTDDINEKLDLMLIAIEQQLAESRPGQIAHATVFHAGNILLLPKCLTALHKFFKLAKTNIPNYLKKIKEAAHTVSAEIATAEGIPITIANNASELLFEVAEIGAEIQKPPQILEKTPLIISRLAIQRSELYFEATLSQLRAEIIQNINDTLQRLGLTVDYEITLNGVDMKHVIQGDWNIKTNKPAGFHSARWFPEKIKEVLIPPSQRGTWQAKWEYNGKFKPSTFFPTNWDEISIVDKIFEALVKIEFIEIRDGGIMLMGSTSEKIAIDLFLSEGGIIKTIYPALKRFGTICIP